MNKVFAIIPAGGSGKRIGGEIPKQYLVFHGKELFAYTLEVFQENELVDEIIIAAQPEFFDVVNEIKSKYDLNKITKIVEGGKERQHSVFNALSSIEAEEDDLILVHDAARPLLSQNILNSAINLAKKNGNAVVAIKARDTLVNGADKIVDYVDRNQIQYVQTPQIFQYKTLKKAMERAESESFIGTDESMLVFRLGESINLVEGSSMNFKITTESDVEMFHLISAKGAKEF